MAIEDLSHVFIGDPTEHIIKPGVMTEANPIREGLVLWYDFAGRSNLDADRLIVEDKSGHGHRGVLQNFAYTEGSGFEPKGLRFDGVDDFVNAGDKPAFDITENLTMEMTVTVTGGYGGFVKGTTGGWASNSYGLRLYGNGYFFYVVEDSGTIQRLAMTVPRGRPCHVVGVLSSKHIMVYVDGREVARADRVVGNLKVQYLPLHVGTAYVGTHTEGTFHTARLYNRALDVNEIAHNYAMERERAR